MNDKDGEMSKRYREFLVSNNGLLEKILTNESEPETLPIELYHELGRIAGSELPFSEYPKGGHAAHPHTVTLQEILAKAQVEALNSKQTNLAAGNIFHHLVRLMLPKRYVAGENYLELIEKSSSSNVACESFGIDYLRYVSRLSDSEIEPQREIIDFMGADGAGVRAFWTYAPSVHQSLMERGLAPLESMRVIVDWVRDAYRRSSNIPGNLNNLAHANFGQFGIKRFNPEILSYDERGPTHLRARLLGKITGRGLLSDYFERLAIEFAVSCYLLPDLFGLGLRFPHTKVQLEKNHIDILDIAGEGLVQVAHGRGNRLEDTINAIPKRGSTNGEIAARMLSHDLNGKAIVGTIIARDVSEGDHTSSGLEYKFTKAAILQTYYRMFGITMGYLATSGNKKFQRNIPLSQLQYLLSPIPRKENGLNEITDSMHGFENDQTEITNIDFVVLAQIVKNASSKFDIEYSESKTHHVITFQDYGTGILDNDGKALPPDRMHEIFGSFSTTGGGLGLQIADRLMQLRGGYIEVISTTPEWGSIRYSTLRTHQGDALDPHNLEVKSNSSGRDDATMSPFIGTRFKLFIPKFQD